MIIPTEFRYELPNGGILIEKYDPEPILMKKVNNKTYVKICKSKYELFDLVSQILNENKDIKWDFIVYPNGEVQRLE
jgi:hypothetical protein